MGTATISYTIPPASDGMPPNTRVDVTLNLTYSDTLNADGSYTVTNATGTYKVGSTTYNIIGVVDPASAAGLAEGSDNHFWPAGNGPSGAYVNFNGINFVTDNPTANGNQAVSGYSGPNVDFYYDAGRSSYFQDTRTGGNFNAAQSVSITITCFAAGTLIRTPRGDVAIETLRAGDVVLTAEDEERPIAWIGHRIVDCAPRARPRDAWPVRIAAGAFAENRPERDLYVSPAHALCVDFLGEVLVYADELVNGATIARVPTDVVDYWHIELESHDILIANGMPAESYSATGERGSFSESFGAVRVERLAASDFCRPFASNVVVAAMRLQLERRAEQLGYARDFDADLRLVADGVEYLPLLAGDSAVFLFPKAAQDIRLRCASFSPADIRFDRDARPLGLSILGLSVSDGRSAFPIALDDARLAPCFHPVEASDAADRRWTIGEETGLPSSLFDTLAGAHVALTISFDASAQRGWKAPAETNAPARPRLYAVRSEALDSRAA
ncbi:Hint domain-containing protein [Methylosinus sp. KRF6]|uniref:Hint domain-containing protein n=2 Tax=Methylosinus TaxID=425 RepID=UPI001C0D4FD1|nr:Hint domain-containing protein [Methylosinus sp. KRF6]MBU3886945.1 Hint domain-containing protein [Methylosinus sp. KRF6]